MGKTTDKIITDNNTIKRYGTHSSYRSLYVALSNGQIRKPLSKSTNKFIVEIIVVQKLGLTTDWLKKN